MVNTNKIKGRIVEYGLTQEKIAKSMDLDLSAFNMKLNNKRRFYIDEIAKLCNMLDINTTRELREFFGLDFLIIPNFREITKENENGGA